MSAPFFSVKPGILQDKGLVWNVGAVVSSALFGGAVMMLAPVLFAGEIFAAFIFGWGVYSAADYLAAGGVNGSAFAGAGAASGDKGKESLVLVSALAAVLVPSFCTALVTALLSLAFSGAYQNALLCAAAALPLYSANKTILWYLAGLSRPKAVAAGRILRYMGVFLFFCIAAYALKGTGEWLMAVFFWAEVLLFVFFVVALREKMIFRARDKKEIFRLAKGHLAFGVGALGGSIIADINVRIGMFLLPIANPSLAGSKESAAFAAAIVATDGIWQVASAVRTVFAPRVFRVFLHGKQDRAERNKRLLGFAVQSLCIVGASVCLLFALLRLGVLSGIVAPDSQYILGIPYMTIIALPMIVFAPLSPFLLLAQSAGCPRLFTLALLPAAAVHVGLVPMFSGRFGFWGVAAAAAVSILFLSGGVLWSGMAVERSLR